MELAATFDVAIVGGGVIGCQIARHLMMTRPELSIAIFDRERIGFGCSAYAGAIISPICLSEQHEQATGIAIDHYHQLLAEQPHGTPWLRSLPVVMVASQSNVAAMKSKVPAALTEVTHEQLPEWFSLPQDHQAFTGATAYQADVLTACMNAVNHPAIKRYECVTVTERHQLHNNDWQLTLADQRQVQCKSLIMATGPWTVHDAALKGTSAAISELDTKKIAAWFVDHPARTDSPLIYLYDHGAFLLPLPMQNQWLMSITANEWGISPSREQLHLNQTEHQQAMALLTQYCPSLTGSLRGGRAHCDGYLPQRLPTITQDSNQIFAVGGSGSGFRYAPWIARQVADAIRP